LRVGAEGGEAGFGFEELVGEVGVLLEQGR
jgi:hypothetical protein